MSKEAFIEFCAEVASKDASLVTDLTAQPSEAEFARLAVEKGRAAGFSFDENEALEVVRAARRQRAATELSDSELQTVAGGAHHGGGQGSGKVSMQDFHFVVRVDKASLG